MDLERTPLLLERRGRTRHARHKAADILRSRSGRTKKRKNRGRLSRLIAREMDTPQRSPLTGLAMGNFTGGMPGGGIIKHA